MDVIGNSRAFSVTFVTLSRGRTPTLVSSIRYTTDISICVAHLLSSDYPSPHFIGVNTSPLMPSKGRDNKMFDEWWQNYPIISRGSWTLCSISALLLKHHLQFITLHNKQQFLKTSKHDYIVVSQMTAIEAHQGLLWLMTCGPPLRLLHGAWDPDCFTLWPQPVNCCPQGVHSRLSAFRAFNSMTIKKLVLKGDQHISKKLVSRCRRHLVASCLYRTCQMTCWRIIIHTFRQRSRLRRDWCRGQSRLQWHGMCPLSLLKSVCPVSSITFHFGLDQPSLRGIWLLKEEAMSGG